MFLLRALVRLLSSMTSRALLELLALLALSSGAPLVRSELGAFLVCLQRAT